MIYVCLVTDHWSSLIWQKWPPGKASKGFLSQTVSETFDLKLEVCQRQGCTDVHNIYTPVNQTDKLFLLYGIWVTFYCYSFGFSILLPLLLDSFVPVIHFCDNLRAILRCFWFVCLFVGLTLSR